MSDTDTHTPPKMSWPKVFLRSAMYHTFIFKKMIREADPSAKPGDCVAVVDKSGTLFGYALYNPRSQIALRMLSFDDTPPDAAFWKARIERAVSLRRDMLRLDHTTNAYRLIHAEGDELSGLIVDRYDSVLAVEIFSLGMWRQIHDLLPMLHEAAGTQHHVVSVDQRVQNQEKFTAESFRSDGCPDNVTITEHGVRFRVEFDIGHKTGFFCDQRDNRRRLAELAAGADVLDLCCYSGGFGIYARMLGQAGEVTCVDLDEKAIALATRNANLNQVRIATARSDAFTYMRQMQTNGRQYDVVVLDPPKLIFGRNDIAQGRRTYSDMNRLAAQLVRDGGLLVTCSCSGALGRDAFVDTVVGACRSGGAQAQILDITGAGPDHPVSPRCPESGYLKAAWLRLHK